MLTVRQHFTKLLYIYLRCWKFVDIGNTYSGYPTANERIGHEYLLPNIDSESKIKSKMHLTIGR